MLPDRTALRAAALPLLALLLVIPALLVSLSGWLGGDHETLALVASGCAVASALLAALDLLRSGLTGKAGRSVSVIETLALGIGTALIGLDGALYFSVGLSAQTVLPAVATAALLLILSAGARVLVRLDMTEPSPFRSRKSLLIQCAAATSLGVLAGLYGFAGLTGTPDQPNFARLVENALATGGSVLLLLWPHGMDLLARQLTRIANRHARARGLVLADVQLLREMRSLGAVVFDRPTLMTSERFVVTDVKAFDKQPEVLLSIAATAEAFAQHPIGTAIRDLARDWDVPQEKPVEHEEAPGLGIVAMIGDEPVAVGNTALMDRLKIDTFTATSLCRTFESAGKICVLVAVGQRVVGVLALQGVLQAAAPDAVRALRQNGCASLIVSGVSAPATRWLTDAIGAEGFRHGIAPQERASAAAAAVGHLNALFIYRPQRAPNSLLICLLKRNDERGIKQVAQVLDGNLMAVPGLLSFNDRIALREKRMTLWNLVLAGMLSVPAGLGLIPLALALLLALLPLALSSLDIGSARAGLARTPASDHPAQPDRSQLRPAPENQ
ncbi:cation-translocating P-type ATPase [Roseibium aestuarii]|uniref:Cation-translocating P-type ATPase n=1 Tax=Roseibium aestuarii TaxID=2600299 RepID=A0ABW4JYZ5_9HYPH|nr:cation-translocating P-type ATPase [Roseibium aestuarii]